MAITINFYKGTSVQYNAAIKDANSFYLVDEKDLYLGSIKLSNAIDLSKAIERIASNENDIADIQSQLKVLIGEDGSGSISSMIDAAVNPIKEQIGTTDLETTAKTLTAAINEVYDMADAGGAVTLESSNKEGYAKSYTIKQKGVSIGSIDIPKDMVVKSGEVVVNPAGKEAGTYVVLTLANATSDKLYINVGTLVDIYTAAANAPKVQIAVDSISREISATIVAGSISTDDLANNAITSAKIANKAVSLEKLSSTVQTSLGRADSGLQSVSVLGTTLTKSSNTLSVADAKTALGLGSAAYTASSAYDAAGSAATAEQNSKNYVDNALKWKTIS